MIRFRVAELMANKQFAEDRTLTIVEVAEKSGVSKVTLSRMINKRGYAAGSDVLDKLCTYFNCRLDELAEYVPDKAVRGAAKKTSKQTNSK